MRECAINILHMQQKIYAYDFELDRHIYDVALNHNKIRKAQCTMKCKVIIFSIIKYFSSVTMKPKLRLIFTKNIESGNSTKILNFVRVFFFFFVDDVENSDEAFLSSILVSSGRKIININISIIYTFGRLKIE